MKHEYVKEVKGGKEAFVMLSSSGGVLREVGTMNWEIGDYIDYCLYPIRGCIERMREEGGVEGAIYEYAIILGRLYDAARVQLEKIDDAIYKGMGDIQIRTTSEQCLGGFLQQDFLEVYVKPEPVEAKVG